MESEIPASSAEMERSTPFMKRKLENPVYMSEEITRKLVQQWVGVEDHLQESKTRVLLLGLGHTRYESSKLKISTTLSAPSSCTKCSPWTL